ncbi:hypothetical protein D3C72_1465990 [compost metagenome]
MKTQDERIRFVPQHKEGHFIDIFSQPVEDFMKAARVNVEEDVERFLLSRFGPSDPQNFRVVPVLITYKLEDGSDVQEK